MHQLGEKYPAARREHDEAVQLGRKRFCNTGPQKRCLLEEGERGRSERDREKGGVETGIRGGVENAKERGVAEDHGDEGTGRGESEVVAAAAEDAEREEMARLGEEESTELACEAEMAVVGGMLVESWISDEFWSGERHDAVGGGRCGGADGEREDVFRWLGKREAKGER